MGGTQVIKHACLNDLSHIPPNNEQNEPTQRDIGETSNEPTQAKRNKFEELYASANEELYPSCDFVTRLDFMAKFTYLKVKGKLNDSIFNEMLEFFQKSNHTAKQMTWHATGKSMENGKMQHMVDGKAWKKFDIRDFFNADLLILGPKSPGKDIDVYLKPLIDDLKDLLALKGVETIDAATGKTFNMRAMLLWTINDFPA
ncbi:hypothetical protein Tco_0982149 [Tanacetum coccineum]